jgi:hypothetical protein
MKIKLIILCVFVFFFTSAHDKIKLYALYTPSHQILKDAYFLPSIKDNFDIILEAVEQTCPSAQFMSSGWTATTIKKIDLIIRAIHENWGTFFIFSDVDIQFFAPIENMIVELIQDKDLIIQKNCPSGVLCSGFFACKANEKTLKLWTDVKHIMLKKPWQSDQITLNQCIKRHSKKNPYDIQWDYLPDIFFGAGTLIAYPGYSWHPGKTLPIPQGIVMHHANWTKGIGNKIAQLEYVQQEVLKRNE